jgi:hypothetical protein
MIDITEEEKKGYFMERTLKHISRVINNANTLFDYDKNRFRDLPEQTKLHDLSKFSDEELIPYIQLTHYYRCKNMGVNIEASMGDKQKISEAVFHHLKTNKHHPEYYYDKAIIVRKNQVIVATNMPILSIAEMVCDWMAMSQEFDNNITDFAFSVINKKFTFSSDQVILIYELIGALTNGQKTVS